MAKMKRNILLIEPGYKNKYPPIGLMKISAYHRRLGDNVTFYKGDVKEFILEQIVADCIDKLTEINGSITWKKRIKSIEKYIKTKHTSKLKELILELERENDQIENQTPLFELWLNHFSDYYKKKKYEEDPKWDRVYVTTLFTFYWKITVKAIHEAKCLVKDPNELKVGGVPCVSC